MVIRPQAGRKGRRAACPRRSGLFVGRVGVGRFLVFSSFASFWSFFSAVAAGFFFWPSAEAAAGFFFLASGAGVSSAAPEPPFILSSMHLSTRSARLSSDMVVAPFSVDIQHCSAARVCVIGGSGGLAASGLTPVPEPVVSQAASARAARASARLRRQTRADGVMAALPKLVQPPPAGMNLGTLYIGTFPASATLFMRPPARACFPDSIVKQPFLFARDLVREPVPTSSGSRAASSPEFFVEAPGSPVVPSLSKRGGGAPRSAAVFRPCRASREARAPLGAPQRRSCPRAVLPGADPARLLARPDPAGFRPPSSAPRPATEGQSLVVGTDGDPRPPGSGVTSPARGRRIPPRCNDVS